MARLKYHPVSAHAQETVVSLNSLIILSFSLKLGPIYIKKLVPGGSALLSGQLQVNDVILQVNNKNVDRMSYRVSS